MSLIIFILVLSILIVVHEWGHFMMAQRLGVKVERFAVGFGKKIFARRHKGTDFMICAIPLGGYIKMAGDERSQCQGRPEEFFSHSVGHRALIVLMGPIINFVFAYLCFYFICVTGFPMLEARVGKVMEGYPARAAGIKENDRIIKIDDKPIAGWEEVQDYVRTSSGDPMTFTIRRGQDMMTRVITPSQKTIKNLFGQEQTVRLVGIQPLGEAILVRYGLGESLGKAWGHLSGVVTTTLRALYYVVTGAMSAKDALAGPVRIFDVIRDAAAMGLAYLVYIMAVISASLAIFNLFPVPVLDGGHLFLLGVEKLRKKPLPVKFEEGLTRLGFSLLVCLMLFIFYNDLIQSGRVAQMILFFQKIKL